MNTPTRKTSWPISWINVFVLSILTTLPALATTVVPPNDHGELAARAELVVLARAVSRARIAVRMAAMSSFLCKTNQGQGVVVPTPGRTDGVGPLMIQASSTPA